ncbi:trypsin-like serine peptidase [Microtetraspora malaysiensis]|uniref:Trypsin-like serine peptidase n=1 Tax=Microtetraspora malaysiensis TaxID=161358 RepID=A0ABW6T2N7_9ACTN
MAMAIESALSFLGTVKSAQGESVGTCFQVAPGVLVTAFHVIRDAGGSQIGARIDFSPIDGDGISTARVERIDERHDLAVLRSDNPLPADVPILSYSDNQRPGSDFHLIGFATLSEGFIPTPRPYLPTIGKWEGKAAATDGTPLARGKSDGVERGMSGSPILRISDGAVIGVLSHRYTSADGWSSGRVWISRIEDLQPLLEGLADIPYEDPAPLTRDEVAWLAETPIDRAVLRRDECFLKPDKWLAAWQTAAACIENGEVLVISSSQGVGATTFAEQLLAQTAPADMRLMRLDPGDWETPMAKALPQMARRAYILDLRDPEHDVPSREFVADLSALASWYRSARSRLVITVADQLWHGRSSKPIQNLQVISLTEGPDSRELVERYISKQSPQLLPIIQLPAVSGHLEGMTAVQAQQAIQTILQVEAENKEIGADANVDLAGLIIARLDDHRDELDVYFGDGANSASSSSGVPARHGDNNRSLSFEDRCLLITLACEKTVRFRQIERDSQRLISVLNGKKSTDFTSVPAHKALAGPGLRGRLDGINAKTSPSEIVAFQRSGFADAAVRYVWSNYASVRKPLMAWLLDLVADATISEDVTTSLISDLVRLNQDVDFIRNDLAKLAIDRKQSELLANVVYDATLDIHMRRRCERLLYDWATRSEMHAVVIEVCRKWLDTDRRNIALRRLRRVADSDRPIPETIAAILAIFSSLADASSMRSWFMAQVTEWIRTDKTTTSARLAFISLMNADIDGTPWLLTSHADKEDVIRMLGELLSDVAGVDGADKAVIQLVERASVDATLYERLMDDIAAAAVTHGAIRSLFSLGVRLSEVGRRINHDPLSDIEARIRIERAPSYSEGDSA